MSSSMCASPEGIRWFPDEGKATRGRWKPRRPSVGRGCVKFRTTSPACRRAERLPAGRRLLGDGDDAVLDLDVAARGEVAEDPAHHVARCANALGDLLLRELFGDLQPAVVLDGEVQQQ